MIFHENRLLADDSHETSYLIFVENWERRHEICRLRSPDRHFKKGWAVETTPGPVKTALVNMPKSGQYWSI